MEMTLAMVQHTHVITSHAYKLHEKKTIACKKASGFHPGGTRNAIVSAVKSKKEHIPREA